MSQRSRLRRRPAALAPVTTPTGPMYQARLGGALGCHFCEAFRKLATIDTYRDIPRALKVMEEGKCFPTVPGVRWARERVEGEFGLFSMALELGGRHALWFRTADMVVEGSNEPMEIGR